MNESESDQPDQLALNVGQAITSRREASGLEGATLARRAGMAPAYLWRLEQGRTLPSLRNLARLAKALEISLPDLLSEVDIALVELGNRPYDRE